MSKKLFFSSFSNGTPLPLLFVFRALSVKIKNALFPGGFKTL